MEYKILSARSPMELSKSINEYVSNGWEVIGSHQVQTIHSQNRYSGQQFMDTRHELEYTISVKRDTNVQSKLDIAIDTLETIFRDAEMAVNGEWDKSDEGFIDQMTLIDNTLSQIK